MLGRWIDADDHVYIENIAVGEKQCPLFVNVFFGGGYTPFVIRPILKLSPQENMSTSPSRIYIEATAYRKLLHRRTT